MHRRTMVALLIGSAVGGAVRLRAAEQPVEIKISAKKFEYHPDKVTVKVGQPVILVLTSEDRIHGFKMPDMLFMQWERGVADTSIILGWLV